MDRLENILINIDLEKGYERLTKREKKVINLYYLEPKEKRKLLICIIWKDIKTKR
jgi:DNA-directed RNA polymerase specialized sigma subunit